MTNASGLQNMVKNIGGAVGTSIVSTIISRMSQVHQAYSVESLTPLNDVFNSRIAVFTGAFSQVTDSVTAGYMAQYNTYRMLIQQSTMWGFIEAFRMIAIVTIFTIPIVFLLKKVNFSDKKQMEELSQ